MSAPPRVVPTLTEVLDEARLRPMEAVPAPAAPAADTVQPPLAPPAPPPLDLKPPVEPLAPPAVTLSAAAPTPPSPSSSRLPHLPREEAALVPELSALGTSSGFTPFPEPPPAPLGLEDFDLDLNLGADLVPAPASVLPRAEVSLPAAAAPMVDQAFLDGLEAGLRQRAGLALDLALDELLEQQLRQRIEQTLARQGEQLLQELRELLAPRLETLVEQALAEVLRQERERLLR